MAHWDVRFFKRSKDDDPSESVPAREFLDSIPTKTQARFFAILDAVRNAPPPAFSGGGYWEAMHDEMTGWHEAREDGPPNRTHYRLFCLLERDCPGHPRPTLAVITGMQKPFQTVFSGADYAAVRALGDEYRSHNPRLFDED